MKAMGIKNPAVSPAQEWPTLYSVMTAEAAIKESGPGGIPGAGGMPAAGGMPGGPKGGPGPGGAGPAAAVLPPLGK
jgi:hypothetical protein